MCARCEWKPLPVRQEARQKWQYSRGPFMAAMFLLVFLDPVFKAIMKQACRQTLKSLAAECLVGVRLGC